MDLTFQEGSSDKGGERLRYKAKPEIKVRAPPSVCHVLQRVF